MKFFLPPANDAETAERSYQAIKKYNEKQTGWQISDVRYYEINYRYNDQAMWARVGELDPLEGQMVIAIFKAKYSHGPYLVCTHDRGVAQGEPILASSDAQAVEFEPESKPQ
jgi:hypothetical protein